MAITRTASTRLRAACRGAATLVGTAGLLMCCGTAAASAAPGDLNASFMDGGTVLTQFGLGSSPMSQGGGVAVASNGDIYQVGAATAATGAAELYVTRRLPDGALDTSFGADGTVYENVGAGSSPETAEPTGTAMAPASVALAANGDPVVVTNATSASGATQLAIIEFTTTGQLDPSFATGGVYRVDVSGSLGAFPGGLTIDSSGNVDFTGTLIDSSYDDRFIAGRVTVDGAADTSFGTNGLIEPTLGSATNSVGLGVIAQSNGDVVFDAFAQGSTTSELALVRTTSSGQLDSGFGTGGVASLPDALPVPFSPGFATTPDGGYAIAGAATVPGAAEPQASVTRLTATGQMDAGFGDGGTAVIQTASMTLGVGTGLIVQPDGRIAITGLGVTGTSSLPQPFVARVNAGGSLDTGFGSGGVSFNPVTGSSSADPAYPIAAAETPDGNVVLSGLTGATPEEAFLQEVNLDTAPTLSFLYAPTSIQVGTPVQFLASADASPDESIQQVSWDFGGGSFGAATGSSVTHTFTTPGTYEIRAQATDGFGLSTISTQTITVTAAPVTTSPVTTATGTTGPATVTPAQAITPTLKLVKLSVSHGKIRITLLCAFAACRVDADLTTHVHPHKGKTGSLSAGGHGKTVTVASTKLNLGVNVIHTFTLELNRAGRKLLARFTKIPAEASFKLTNRTPAKTVGHEITVH